MRIILIVVLFVFPGIANASFATFDIQDSLNTYIFGVNNSGQAAGYYNPSSNSVSGYIRNSNGSIVTLDVFGSNHVIAFDINNNGDSVGMYFDGSKDVGFIRKSDGTLSSIDIAGSTFTHIYGMNDAGDIVGVFHDSATNKNQGFIRYETGQFTLLESSTSLSTAPQKIANDGTVVGYSAYSDGYNHAFKWSESNGFTLLDINGSSYGYGINNYLDFVGSVNGYQAFRLASDNSFSTYNHYLAFSTTFYDISDTGLIGGTYWDITSGRAHGLLGTFESGQSNNNSVPEPETYALILSGLGLLGAMRNRKLAAI